MRGVGIWGSLFAVVSAAAVLVSIEVRSATAGEAASGTEGTPAKRDDYYTRRAKGILAAERNSAITPHPLAASYPGMDVVVCEAGCPDRKGANVVFMRRHVEVKEETTGLMVPTSNDDTATPEMADSVVCVGGCYGEAAESIRPVLRAPAPQPLPVKRLQPPVRDKLSPIR